ncbi:MAG TPA: GNAT family protein [Bacillota bacterium]
MELVGTKIRLRPFAVDDLSKMAFWNKDEELQVYVDCDLPGNRDELEIWYHDNIPDRYYRIFAIETLKGQLIGDLELDHICWIKREAELRIRIGEKGYWGQGIGAEALRLILEHVFTVRQFRRVYLRVYHFNERAIRCYSKLGFRPIGRLHRNTGNWKDIILMELSNREYQRGLRSLAG